MAIAPFKDPESKSFKVTHFNTNGEPICEFLCVNMYEDVL